MKMKKCPNCGAELAATAKFCTHCGADLTKPVQSQSTSVATTAKSVATSAKSVAGSTTTTTIESQATSAQAQATATSATASQSAATNSSVQVQQLQSSAKNYFSWLLNSWKRPSTDEPGESYFAYISFVIEALLITATGLTIVNRILAVFNNSQPVLNTQKLSFLTDLKFFLVVLLGMVFYIGIGFAVSALGNQGSKIGFSAYVSRFARLTNYAMIVNLLLFFSAFMVNAAGNIVVVWSTTKPAIVLFSLGCLIWQLGLVLSVTMSIDQPIISKAYLVLIAVVLVSILFDVMIRLIGQDIGFGMLGHVMTQLSSFLDSLGQQY